MLPSPLHQPKGKPEQYQNNSANQYSGIGVNHIHVLNDAFFHCVIVVIYSMQSAFSLAKVQSKCSIL
jgi:hypothetical protein